MAEIVALPLKLTFNRSMLSNKLPLEWKSAKISPIFEKGSESELGNCRPVSITAVACKIMESITEIKCRNLHKKIISRLTSDQHGFGKSGSRLTHVLEALGDWRKVLVSGDGIDVTNLDYKKACI